MNREMIIKNLKENQVEICKNFTEGQCMLLLMKYRIDLPQSNYEKLEIVLKRDGKTLFMINLINLLTSAYSHKLKKFCEFVISEFMDDSVKLLIFSFEMFKEWLIVREDRMDISNINDFNQNKCLCHSITNYFSENIIYELICRRCDAFYIEETWNFRRRLNDNISNKNIIFLENSTIYRVIENEDIYRNFGNYNCISSKQGKSITLKYESIVIDEKIAQGGYGTVYKSHSFHKQYALKKMCVNNEDKLLNCIREIFILRNVHCEYILHFVDSIIYQTDSDIFEVFILTDFYSDNLSSEMKSTYSSNRCFSESDILLIMTNIAEAVACLHHFPSTPIIHRDLKVENILIGYPMRYVLCDFGSATLKEVRPCDVNRQELQDEISQFTTLAYRSPEMADLYYDGGDHVIGRKADIWALGVLMYNICFFSLPFGDSVLSILSAQFTVPDNCPYSTDLLKTLNYILTPNPESRPNIHQLASLLFSIASKSNPVQNYEKTSLPDLNELNLPMTESEFRLSTTKTQKKNSKSSGSNQRVETSIIPRERPKAGGKPQNYNSYNDSNKNNVNKSNITEDKSTNLNSQNADLLVFESPLGSENNHFEKTNQFSKTKSVDKLECDDVDTNNLMDFTCQIDDKIKQLVNTPKSHSLSKNFGTHGPGEHFNVYEMISHSYQNVSSAQQFRYNSNNVQAHAMRPFMNNYPIHNNNPFFMNNHCNIRNFGTPQNFNTYGHRRLVSDPSQWFQSPNIPNQVSNPVPTNICRMTKIFQKSGGCDIQCHAGDPQIALSASLQPQKRPMKIKPINVLDEFDPLTK